MTMKGKTLLKGHALVGEGHPSIRHGEDGHIWFTFGTSFGEPRPTVAHCSCGAASPEGLSIKGNQRWHREHKHALRLAEISRRHGA